MANVAIIINTSKKLTNAEYPICLRVTHEYKRQYFAINALITNQSLRFRCSLADWKPAEAEDNGLGKFRKSFSTYKECNAILESKLQEAQAILQRYDKEGIPFTFTQFESDLKHKEVRVAVTLHDYYAEQMKLLNEQRRVGLSGLFKECQRMLDKFRPNALISDVNIRFLESYEYWLRHEKNNKDTTISVKMRNLQRVMNLAIEDKLIKPESYPFGEKKYSINKRLDHSTRKIAIHTDKIAKLKALLLEPGTALHFAQKICLFSYYCRGMNFIDITYLKWDAISETHIECTSSN